MADQVVVIGGGAGGLMAAITLARAGHRVVLVEKNKELGRKILTTGNGRCNVTNRDISIEKYHGASKEFVQTTLEKFDQFATMEFFESLGVALKEEDKGRIFPRTNQATTIVDALKHALENENIPVKTGVTIKSIEAKNGFKITAENGGNFEADKLILATGGKAAFQFGSSGDGIFWATKLGHNIIPIYAALVPLETKEVWAKDLQGIKVEAKVISKVDKKIVRETEGDVLFTHFGISGPAVMAHAGSISPFVDDRSVQIILDLYPEDSQAQLDKKVEQIFQNNNKKSVKNSLAGLIPAALVSAILDISKLNKEKNAAEVSKQERLKIVEIIKNLELNISKVRPLKEAQVSRGGVDTNEVDGNTLESKIVKGLYFAGEVLDVDADSGGFNLQWAWSSGFVAGKLQ
jgi:predicted Rossmann fold flavoprotein